MIKALKSSVFLLLALFAPFALGSSLLARPFAVIDIKSYDALSAAVAEFFEAAGQDTSMADAQLVGMIGPQVMELVDRSRPWHIAVWMESPDQAPVYGLVLPVEDYEKFQPAVQATMLGMMGARHMDAGESVVVYGSKPGAVLPDGWDETMRKYASSLSIEVSDTVEADIFLNDQFRGEFVKSISGMRTEMKTVFEDPEVAAESGMEPESIAGIMDAYFSIGENLLRDTDSFHVALNLRDGSFQSTLALKPLAGTGTVEFIESQQVYAVDIALLVDWSGDSAMVMGMADLPKSWEADLRKLWEGLMPLYGLNADEADVWMELFDVTLPMRGSFEMSFSDGVRFAGFYDILDAPAAAVYEKWLNVTGGMATGDDGFYKDFAIKRAHREIDGLKVDSISFAMNPENPAMELPEQKAMMEQMFPGGKMTYEMAIKDERIYMATEGKLDRLLSAKPGKAPPVEINEHTRFAVSYNFLAFMKLGMSASDAPGMPDFSKMDTEGTSVGYAFDISDRLVLRSAFPLKLISVFTQMMMPADPAI